MAMRSMTKRQGKVGGLMGERNTLAKCRKQRLFQQKREGVREQGKIILIHMVARYLSKVNVKTRTNTLTLAYRTKTGKSK